MPVSRIPSTRLLSAAVLGLLAGLLSRAEAQSELVVHKAGTTQYHRAGCELIKDGKGVLALTRAQAEARGYKPHPDCDPALLQPDARAGRDGTAGRAAPPAKPQTVYVDGTKYYHRKDCRRLDANRHAVRAESLDVAGKSSWPCPDCRPPVRPRRIIANH
jgi:hypothetical protein